jgi:hypothetical protein
VSKTVPTYREDLAAIGKSMPHFLVVVVKLLSTFSAFSLHSAINLISSI